MQGIAIWDKKNVGTESDGIWIAIDIMDIIPLLEPRSSSSWWTINSVKGWWDASAIEDFGIDIQVRRHLIWKQSRLQATAFLAIS